MERLTMNVAELAEEMGISRPKAYELIKREDFPAFNVGRRVVIPTEAFKAWLLRMSDHERNI